MDEDCQSGRPLERNNRISYEVSKEDLIAWNLYFYTQKGRKSWFIRWRDPILGFVFVVLGVFLVSALDFQIIGAFWIVYGLYLIVAHRGLVNRNLGKSFEKYYENAGLGLLGLVTLEIIEGGLLEKTAASETKVSWDVVGPVISENEYSFIVINGMSAAVINRNQLKSGSLDLFLEEVKSRTSVAM